MELRPHRIIERRRTREIKVGNVSVGGTSKISVQSMTNTLTTDVKATINQINEIHSAGADIVRVSCPDEPSSKSLKDKSLRLSGKLLTNYVSHDPTFLPLDTTTLERHFAYFGHTHICTKNIFRRT